MKLTQEQRKDYHSLCIFNNLDVDFKINQIKVLERQICGEQQLSSGEFYSTFYVNKDKKESIESMVEYKMNPSTIRL